MATGRAHDNNIMRWLCVPDDNYHWVQLVALNR